MKVPTHSMIVFGLNIVISILVLVLQKLGRRAYSSGDILQV